jgi:uncharacterized protein YcbX
MDVLGTVAAIWRYPVKGLAPESLASVEIEPDGVAGDRSEAIVVEEPDHARAGKPYRGKEDHLLHLCRSADDALALAASRDLRVSRRNGGRYFDDSAVSLILDGWLAEAAALCGMPIEALRFRPNLLIKEAPGAKPAEADLVGRRLTVGSAELVVTKPIDRCVTVTYHPATGEPEPRVLMALARDRANTMGVYCEVVRAGRVSLDDTLLAAGAVAL